MARPILLTLTAALWAGSALASEDIADKYPQSVLYNKPVEVIPNVWSSIGATAPPTYENAGHNNNLSFIITGDGVVVVNSGASYKLAEALHAEIRARTDQPVKLVIAENGQGHAMLGNNYWINRACPCWPMLTPRMNMNAKRGRGYKPCRTTRKRMPKAPCPWRRR